MATPRSTDWLRGRGGVSNATGGRAIGAYNAASSPAGRTCRRMPWFRAGLPPRAGSARPWQRVTAGRNGTRLARSLGAVLSVSTMRSATSEAASREPGGYRSGSPSCHWGEAIALRPATCRRLARGPGAQQSHRRLGASPVFSPSANWAAAMARPRRNRTSTADRRVGSTTPAVRK